MRSRQILILPSKMCQLIRSCPHSDCSYFLARKLPKQQLKRKTTQSKPPRPDMTISPRNINDEFTRRRLYIESSRLANAANFKWDVLLYHSKVHTEQQSIGASKIKRGGKFFERRKISPYYLLPLLSLFPLPLPGEGKEEELMNSTAGWSSRRNIAPVV